MGLVFASKVGGVRRYLASTMDGVWVSEDGSTATLPTLPGSTIADPPLVLAEPDAANFLVVGADNGDCGDDPLIEDRSDLGGMVSIVVDDQHTVRFAVTLESAFGAVEVRECRSHLHEVDPEAVSHRHGSERILQVMAPGDRET